MPRKFKFIGCEIIYREACLLAARSPDRVDVEFLRKGLHDLETADMVAKVQETVDAVDPDEYEAILLGYARCNDGLVGVQAREIPLVIPRAHDCITLFFGSRNAYRAYHDAHPGTYFLTTGWSERNLGEGAEDRSMPAYGRSGVMARLGLTDSYEELVAKYGCENAEYIIESVGGWEKAYTDLLYIEMGVCDEAPFIEQARERAAEKGWTFSRREGDWSLLERLFAGDWDEDFVIVPPGGVIEARNDKRVLGVKPRP